MTSDPVRILQKARASARAARGGVEPPGGTRDPRGRHYGGADPYGVKEDLQRLGIGLREISARLGGASLGHISNVLSGRQHSPRMVAATRGLIADRGRDTVP